jgi:hypothetical protein
MNVQVRRIAESNFLELWNMGWTRPELAEHYGVHYRTINQVVEYMGLLPVLPADLAPTPDEDRASRESLRLAPMVAEKARAYWEKHLEARRNESESASQTRDCEWRQQQQESRYQVILSHSRVLE